MTEHESQIDAKLVDDKDLEQGLVGTEIKDIVFEDPITMYPGDRLICDFTFTENGLSCEITLKTADGQEVTVGENVHDIIESGPDDNTR
jgi:hypothetical protein